MQAASSPLRESWQYDTEKQCLIFVWKKRIVHNKKWRNMVMPGLCSKYDSTSLYFSVKVLLIQQIGSMRPVIKGQELGIFSCCYKHDPQLFSQENRGKIELKEINSCLVPCLLLVFNQQLKILVTAALFSIIKSQQGNISVIFQLTQGLTGFVGKIMKKTIIIEATAVRTLYVHVYPLGLSLSFEASIANDDSPVTSHKNLQWHL